MFLEDQTIEDFEKHEKSRSTNEYPIDLGPVAPPADSKNKQAESNVESETISTDPEPIFEQVPPEPQLRRSTCERQSSRGYSPNEYVMLTDGGESGSYQEAVFH